MRYARMIRPIIITAALLCFPFVSFSHPPTDIELSYDQAAQVLKVTMKHITHESRDHFIRRINVYKNDEEVTGKVFPSQRLRQAVEEEFAVEAVVGDVLRIKAFCSEGGIGEASMTVDVEEETKEPEK